MLSLLVILQSEYVRHIVCCHRNQSQVSLLSPNQSVLYTWDDPTSERTLMWNVYNRKKPSYPAFISKVRVFRHLAVSHLFVRIVTATLPIYKWWLLCPYCDFCSHGNRMALTRYLSAFRRCDAAAFLAICQVPKGKIERRREKRVIMPMIAAAMVSHSSLCRADKELWE